MNLASLPLAAAAAAASLLAIAPTAHAEPGNDPGAFVDPAATAASTDAYLEPGLEIGITPGAFYGAVELDGGHRLGDTPLWLHGRFAQGNLSRIEEKTMSSDFTEARLGLEARGCVFAGIACLVAGVDLGYRHEMYVSDFGRGTADLGLSTARLGLDLGSPHLRFRPSVETGVQQGGWLGLGVTAGLAYTW